MTEDKFWTDRPALEQIQGELAVEKHIFLTGFMGVGKTTVGQLLSKLLARPFLDMDQELERQHQKKVSEIFETFGEAGFRRAESSLLADLFNHDRPLIISTGGGVVEDPRNREMLKGAETFFLDLQVKNLWDRLTPEEHQSRPLARDFATFKKRFKARRPLYLECGRVMNADQSPEEIAEYIRTFLLEDLPITLSTETRLCLISSFKPKKQLTASLIKLTERHKLFLLLDQAFRAEKDFWQEILPQAVIYFTESQGETAKTLAEAEKLLLAISEARLDRSDWLVVRGGGSLTDLGAFCAGLFRRGLNLLLLPTTLLGAVDAAIGGKTAVNLAGAKNQVGHFYLPREVWMEPEVLSELKPELLCEGLVEALKTGLLLDEQITTLVFRHLDTILLGDMPLITEIIHRSARAKARLVEDDFREELGHRDTLNLGHTYGHVVESYHASREPVSHGRAVALGLAVTLALSSRHFGLDPHLAETVTSLCLRLAGGQFPPLVPANEARRLLTFDKKIRDGRLKFVILKGQGQPEVLREVDPDLVLEAAASLEKNMEKQLVGRIANG